jgi:hypothetical protein
LYESITNIGWKDFQTGTFCCTIMNKDKKSGDFVAGFAFLLYVAPQFMSESVIRYTTGIGDGCAYFNINGEVKACLTVLGPTNRFTSEAIEK